jgi:hypothetical protein
MTTYTTINDVQKAFPARSRVCIGAPGGRTGRVAGWSEGTAFDGTIGWSIRVVDGVSGGTIGIFTPDALTIIPEPR